MRYSPQDKDRYEKIAKTQFTIDRELLEFADSLFAQVNRSKEYREIPEKDSEYIEGLVKFLPDMDKEGFRYLFRSVIELSAQGYRSHGLKFSYRKGDDSSTFIASVSAGKFGSIRQVHAFAQLLLLMGNSQQELRFNWLNVNAEGVSSYRGGSSLVTKDHVSLVTSSDVVSMMKSDDKALDTIRLDDDIDNNRYLFKVGMEVTDKQVVDSTLSYVDSLMARGEDKTGGSAMDKLVVDELEMLRKHYDIGSEDRVSALQFINHPKAIPGKGLIMVMPDLLNYEGEGCPITVDITPGNYGNIGAAATMIRLTKVLDRSEDITIISAIRAMEPTANIASWAVIGVNTHKTHYFGGGAIESYLRGKMDLKIDNARSRTRSIEKPKMP